MATVNMPAEGTQQQAEVQDSSVTSSKEQNSASQRHQLREILESEQTINTAEAGSDNAEPVSEAEDSGFAVLKNALGEHLVNRPLASTRLRVIKDMVSFLCTMPPDVVEDIYGNVPKAIHRAFDAAVANGKYTAADKADDAAGEEEYEVEMVLAKKNRKGKALYLVKWLGYGRNANTWEPVEHLQNASEKIEVFEDKVGRKAKRGRPAEGKGHL